MMTGAWALGGWIWMAVWIVALLAMVWLAVGGWRREEREDPLDLLRARYARGEISEDEFRHARQILGEPIGGTR